MHTVVIPQGAIIAVLRQKMRRLRTRNTRLASVQLLLYFLKDSLVKVYNGKRMAT